MSMLDYAKKELDIIGMTEDGDEMNAAMRHHILHIVEEFAKEGHSGFSASYAISCLEKLLKFEPLSPLTGDDSEWNDVGDGILQNKRCSRVFKKDGQAYDIDAVVFYDEYVDDEGETRKSYYTCYDSRRNVTFPYTPTTEYAKRPEEKK